MKITSKNNDQIKRVLQKMASLGITPNSTLSLAEIREIEAKLQLELPESYVNFLTEIQNDSQSHQLHQKAPYYGFYSLLNAPYGSAFFRNEDGIFEEEDFEPRE